jgi:putative membrane protein
MTETLDMKATLRGRRFAALHITLKGFCMGTADVVPGVSGGTIALILGIYQRLLEAIGRFDVKLLKLLTRGDFAGAAKHIDWLFLIPLGVGIFAALMFFTRVVSLPHLVQTQPELVFATFFGLIIGSVVLLLRGLGTLDFLGYVFLITGSLIGFGVVNLVPVETPESAWFIFVTGAVAISALILPGISGSFLLLIMKKYAFIFDALGRFDFAVIVPFTLGAAVGLLGFSRVLVWLLRCYYEKTLLTIVGVLIGSLWVIWPFQERLYETVRDKPRVVASTPYVPDIIDGSVVTAGALALIGLALVLLLGRLSRNASSARA